MKKAPEEEVSRRGRSGKLQTAADDEVREDFVNFTEGWIHKKDSGKDLVSISEHFVSRGLLKYLNMPIYPI